MEIYEARYMGLLISTLLQHYTPASIVWLHDGVWVSPPPDTNLMNLARQMTNQTLGFSIRARCKPLDIERIVLINSIGPPKDPLAGVKLRVAATRKAEHTISNIASRAKRRKTAADQQLTATKALKRKASTAQLNLFAFFAKKNKT